MGNMVSLEQLDTRAAEWLSDERAQGLIDIKFFPGEDREVLDRAALGDFLDMMEFRQTSEFTDITDQII
jgi:hypothetical protein